MQYDSGFNQMMHDVFGSFDLSVFSFFGSIQNDILNFLAGIFSTVGESIFAILFGVLFCVLFLFKRTRKISFLFLAVLVLFFAINNLVIKNTVCRLRPYNMLQGNSEYFSWYMNAGQVAETAYSFPSGHTCFSFAAAVVLFLWLFKDKQKRSAFLIFILPVIVACSRIYLMVHYPSDVLAGAILGILIGIFAWYLDKFCVFEYKKIFSGNKDFLDKIDLEPWLTKKLGHKLNDSKVVKIIVILVICISAIAFVKFAISQATKPHCFHQGPDYICMNRSESKLYNEDTNNWEYYCELHS